MSGPLDEPDDGATPLTPEEREGLIPTHILTRGDLNELEEQNIAEGRCDLRAPRFVDHRLDGVERDQRSCRVAGVDGERDTAPDTVRHRILEELVGSRIFAALARLVPDER